MPSSGNEKRRNRGLMISPGGESERGCSSRNSRPRCWAEHASRALRGDAVHVVQASSALMWYGPRMCGARVATAIHPPRALLIEQVPAMCQATVLILEVPKGWKGPCGHTGFAAARPLCQIRSRCRHRAGGPREKDRTGFRAWRLVAGRPKSRTATGVGVEVHFGE